MAERRIILADESRTLKFGFRALLVPLLLVVAGLVVGGGVFAATPATYTAESRIALGKPALSPAQVPAYAAAMETLGDEYARFVDDSAGYRRKLSSGDGQVTAVAASPIPGSGVIRLEAEATSGDAAVNAANRLATDLIEQIKNSTASASVGTDQFSTAYLAYLQAQEQAQSAQAAYEALTRDPAVDVDALATARDAARAAAAQAAIANLEQQALGTSYRDAYSQSAVGAAVNVIRTADEADAGLSERLQRTVGVGAIVGLALALGLLYLRARPRRGNGRRRLGGGVAAPDSSQ